MAERGGLPWYQIWSEFSGHSKTLDLCGRLEDHNAGMYVIRLWEHCAEHALDGKIPVHVIEGAAEWHGKRGVLLAALEASGWLEGDGDSRVVHDWEERNGARIRDWIRDNAKRKPSGNPGGKKAKTPAGSTRKPSGNPPGNPAGFPVGTQADTPLETPREPRGIDGRSETSRSTEAIPPTRAVPATDDLPRPKLVVFDADGEPVPPLPRSREEAQARDVERHYPLTLVLLGELERRGWNGGVATNRATRGAIESAVKLAGGVPTAADRLMAMVQTERAAGREPRPSLGWHLETIGGGKSARRITAGAAVPAPAEAFSGGERDFS
jgi:hypothetical protein